MSALDWLKNIHTIEGELGKAWKQSIFLERSLHISSDRSPPIPLLWILQLHTLQLN